MGVKITSSRVAKNLDAFLRSVQSKSAAVGFFSEAKYPDGKGTPVAYVASIQEFGTDKIPPRPFMRPAISSNKSELTRVMQAITVKASAGNITYEQGLAQAGMAAEGFVRKAIIKVTEPALAASTMRWRMYSKSKDFNYTKGKGAPDPNVSNKPLVWTGHMLGSVASKVIGKGSM